MDFPGFNGHEKYVKKPILTLPQVPDTIFDEFWQFSKNKKWTKIEKVEKSSKNCFSKLKTR